MKNTDKSSASSEVKDDDKGKKSKNSKKKSFADNIKENLKDLFE